MSIEVSVLLIGIINIASLAFGYGVLWTQVKTLKGLVDKIEALISTMIALKLEDHEKRLLIIEQKHDRCQI